MKKLKKIVEIYYDFFDRKIDSSLFVVGVVSLFIFGLGMNGTSKSNYLNYSKASIVNFDTKKMTNNYNSDEIVVNIGGKNYKIIITEL